MISAAPRDATTRTEEPTLVYVSSASAHEIGVFFIDRAAGRLRPVQRLAVGGSPGAITVCTERRIAYAVVRGNMPFVAALTIDPESGRLALLAQTPVGEPAAYLATDASARYLLSASYTGATFSIAPIGGDGTVASQALQSNRTPPHAHCVRTTADNRFVFVSSLGGDVILQYVFDADTGRVHPNSKPFAMAPKGSGPRHLVLNPSGTMLYANGELDGSVLSYAVDRERGQLEYVARTDIMPESSAAAPWGADLHVAPDGRHIYASERRTHIIAILRVDTATGIPQIADRVATEAQPRSFALDRSGMFLVVAGEKSQQVTLYRVEAAGGGLAALDRRTVGEKPVWVTAATLTRNGC